jgi:hypothetical protein
VLYQCIVTVLEPYGLAKSAACAALMVGYRHRLYVSFIGQLRCSFGDIDNIVNPYHLTIGGLDGRGNVVNPELHL